jgi:ribonucleotide monophosphatase NagD (HAD superfamily)
MKKTDRLDRVRCFLLDMDGTFNLGERLIGGSLTFIETLDQLGLSYLFLTNNSSRHRGFYANKITRLGLPVPEDGIFTSGEATALFLRKMHPGTAGITTCLVLSGKTRQEDLKDSQFQPDYIFQDLGAIAQWLKSNARKVKK